MQILATVNLSNCPEEENGVGWGGEKKEKAMLFELGFQKQPHGGRQGPSTEECEGPNCLGKACLGFGKYPKERINFFFSVLFGIIWKNRRLSRAHGIVP